MSTKNLSKKDLKLSSDVDSLKSSLEDLKNNIAYTNEKLSSKLDSVTKYVNEQQEKEYQKLVQHAFERPKRDYWMEFKDILRTFFQYAIFLLLLAVTASAIICLSVIFFDLSNSLFKFGVLFAIAICLIFFGLLSFGFVSVIIESKEDDHHRKFMREVCSDAC